jgi:hypothetical protein
LAVGGLTGEGSVGGWRGLCWRGLLSSGHSAGVPVCYKRNKNYEPLDSRDHAQHDV